MKPDKYYKAMIDRNLGILSEEEQFLLKNSRVAVAGCGGMGGILAEQLVRSGIVNIKLADPENYEMVNIGHQFMATAETIGKNKAKVTAKRLKKIYPYANIEIYENGISSENVSEFINQTDIVFDCIDYNQFYYSTILHSEARKNNLYVIAPQGIAFGASVLIFDPNGLSLQDYVGLKHEATPEEVKKFQIPLEKFCPIVPEYADKDLIRKIILKEVPIPNLCLAQALATSISTAEAIFIILKKRNTIVVPDSISIDLLDLKLITNKN